MIELLADQIRDPLFQNIYMVVAFAIMIGPMVALTLWYHGNVNRTAGGRALMREQKRHNATPRTLSGSVRNMRTAGSMSRDIARGAYGDDVRQLQNRTYMYVIGWVIANVIVFGALIWAQDYNQRRDAASRKAPTITSEPVRQ